MDLSIIIVNWNTRELLRACLSSLRTALAPLTCTAEVLVVDNASGDGSARMVAEEFPEVRLLANHENRNYAAGNNQGIAASTGTALLLLNPDTELPNPGLLALLELLESDPEVGAVAPALVYPDGRLQSSIRGFPAPRALLGDLTGLAWLLPRSSWASYRPAGLPEDRPSPVEQPMASAFLVRREAIEAVGPFDEEFPLFFNDVDLCYRLKAAGWEILYEPRVRVIHHGGASTRQVRPEAIRASHAGLRLFYARHYRRSCSPILYQILIAGISVSGAIRVALACLRSRRTG